MGYSTKETPSVTPSPEELKPPFFITKEEERDLRIRANRLTPSPVINQAASFDEYVRQLMIPTIVMEMARKAENLRFSAWEIEAVRASLFNENGLLNRILKDKYDKDKSHPPYIRVACSGKGDYDNLAGYSLDDEANNHDGDYGSPIVLELWPSGNYSPMHSHGETTGIIFTLSGQIDVMAYNDLDWNAEKMGLLTLTPGQCAWLTKDSFAVHKVYCPMSEGDFAATFHVYLNEDELLVAANPNSRDAFQFINEEEPHEKKEFRTYSDLSWRILRKVIADYSAKN